MITLRHLRALALSVSAGVLLSACAETQFVMHTAKRLGDTNKSQGTYKVGNPYTVNGITYYPQVDMEYDDTGIASWYGPEFHGKQTANGEIFDQWEVSAAHKTLPMPSMVRVTNLDNGRSLVVRVNDRGPFKSSRIIDMSRRAAQLLGFEGKGTAKVRVQILAQESQILAERARAGGEQLAQADAPIKTEASAQVASQPVSSEVLAPPEGMTAAEPLPVQKPVATTQRPAIIEAKVGDVTNVPVTPTRIYIQAGAFSDINNAERVKSRLNGIGAVSISPAPVNGRKLFRVRLGPIDNVDDADRLLAEVVQAGYAGARTVVDKTAID